MNVNILIFKVVGNNKPICSCKPNFFGDPLIGCTRECQQDSDCGYTQKCDIKYRSALYYAASACLCKRRKFFQGHTRGGKN